MLSYSNVLSVTERNRTAMTGTTTQRSTIELQSPWVTTSCWVVSNHRQSAYETDALPLSYSTENEHVS